MVDTGHTDTEDIISALEDEITALYRKAGEEAEERMLRYLQDFARQDEKNKKSVIDGKMSERKYKKWRAQSMATGQRYKNVVKDLATDLSHATEIAATMANNRTADAYATNHNWAAYTIEDANTGVSFDLYDRATVERLITSGDIKLPQTRVDLPEELRWNTRKIHDEITSGILQGKSIPDIAKGLQSVADMDKRAAIRNARTLTTGAQNAGRQDTYAEAAQMGIDLRREWVSAIDDRTREAHAKLDGQLADVDKPFKSILGDIMYPGDPDAVPANVYNCRCTLAAYFPELDGIEKPRRTYGEWKGVKSSQKNTTKGVQNIIGQKINPRNIIPVNEITDFAKYNALTYDFEHDGYNGRPIVAMDMGEGQHQALTGSHRVFAARTAGIDIPTVVIPYDEELANARDDVDRAEIAKRLYGEKKIGNDAYKLLTYEEESNVSNEYSQVVKAKAELYKAEQAALKKAEEAEKEAAKKVAEETARIDAEKRAVSESMSIYKSYLQEITNKYGAENMWSEMTDAEMSKLDDLERTAYKG